MSERVSSTDAGTQARRHTSEAMAWVEMVRLLASNWRVLILVPVLIGLAAVGATYTVKPLFTARVSFLPPQQQVSAAAAALSQLSNLAGLASTATGLRSPAEQYVAIMVSVSVLDRVVDRFNLLKVYDEEFRVDARRRLLETTRANVGKKDGLIAVEVDDTDPKRAADIANAYVEELRRTVSSLNITEAQQRRAFFEQRLAEARDELASAQRALQQSGFSQGALRAEPRAAAEAYGRLKAEISAAEVRLQTLRQSRAETAIEVQQTQASLSALRTQLGRLEQNIGVDGNSDYISIFREYKYREALFELFSKQYELARVDEAREGSLIQVIDTAIPPERKSWPRRGIFAMAVTAGSGLLLCVWILASALWRRAASEPSAAT